MPWSGRGGLEQVPDAAGEARARRTPRELAEALGVSEQTLRNWRRQDARGERDDGLTSDEREKLRRLRRENARLRQDEVLRAAAWSGLRTGAAMSQR